MTAFDRNADEYDRWFDENEKIYLAEIRVLQKFIPEKGLGLEIGVGTGRFSVPFQIRIGVDPAAAMAQIAKARGIAVIQAKGECLPFRENRFDFALMVTTLCFVRDVPQVLLEVRRVLRKKGRMIVGFIERDSVLGRSYESRKHTNKFYREARFFSAPDLIAHVRKAGFSGIRFRQKIFHIPGDDESVCQAHDGYGEGAFVILSAIT